MSNLEKWTNGIKTYGGAMLILLATVTGWITEVESVELIQHVVSILGIVAVVWGRAHASVRSARGEQV